MFTINEKLQLTPLEALDAPRLVELLNNRNVTKWMRLPFPFTGERAAAMIERSQSVPCKEFAIRLDGQLVGGIRFTIGTADKVHELHLGYWLGEPYWGQSIMSTCVAFFIERVVKDWFIMKLRHRGIHRIEARVVPANTASEQVLKKCGLVREGVLKQGMIHDDGTIMDQIIYATTFALEPSEFVIPVTPEVVLRRVQLKDIDELFRNFSNYNVLKYTRASYPNTLERSTSFVKRNLGPMSTNFAITLVDGDRSIGMIGLMPGSKGTRHQAEVGYWIAEEHWGK
ncbi:hypothetical protein HDU91_002961, partial [Kappamyces sp. JEL0680]